MRKASAQGVFFSQLSTDLECLDVIALRGPVTAGELAAATGLTTGAVTGVIDRLERSGFALRERDGSDRRKVLVRALPAVERPITPLFEPMQRAMGAAIASYGDNELVLLIDSAIAVAAHHVVDLDWLTARFNDLALHHDPGRGGLLAGHLEPLSVIAIEAVGIDCRDVASEAFAYLLALRLAQTGPGRANRKPHHRANVEGAANDRRQSREAPALAQTPAILHRVEQSVVETLHSLATARWRRLRRMGQHAEAEAGGESYSFPQWCFRYDRKASGLIQIG